MMKLTPPQALPPGMKWFAGTVKVGKYRYAVSVPASDWNDAEAALNDFYGPGIIVVEIAGTIRGAEGEEDA